jgi:hypothetical protein
MTNETKKTIDNIIKIVFYGVFSPFVILYFIAIGLSASMKFLFENLLNPLYNKVCIIIRRPIPNSTVNIMGKDDIRFKRANKELLTIKEAKALGQQYE